MGDCYQALFQIHTGYLEPYAPTFAEWAASGCEQPATLWC